jgi:DsbC/DsbD-like thiol-disulfide interchange protein
MMNGPFRTLVLLAGWLALTAPPGLAAGPDFPEPEVGIVVSGGGLVAGAHHIGVEIDLPDGWHTYWRSPGDAGLPPVFDPSASTNLKAFEVSWPAPERYLTDDIVSIVYHGRPLLPVRVVPVDPSRPVELSVRLDYGYCREVCIPASAELSATLDPAAPADLGATSAIAKASAAVPVPETAAPAEWPRVASLKRIGDDRKTAVLRIAVDAADPAAVDLFAEPPDGWYLTVPRAVGVEDGRAVFELPLRGMPRKAAFAGAAFRFTVVGPDGAVEAVRTLD